MPTHRSTSSEYRKEYNRRPDVKAHRAEWKRRNYYERGGRDVSFARGLIYKYGITLDDYKNILQKQSNCCALCCKSFVGKPRTSIHVDHIHGTKYIRGILCSSCNTGLGKLGDTVEALTKALNYLKGV